MISLAVPGLEHGKVGYGSRVLYPLQTFRNWHNPNIVLKQQHNTFFSFKTYDWGKTYVVDSIAVSKAWFRSHRSHKDNNTILGLNRSVVMKSVGVQDDFFASEDQSTICTYRIVFGYVRTLCKMFSIDGDIWQ